MLIGFDGFIDTLLHCVRRRHNPRSFQRLKTIPELSNKIVSASAQSTNIECVVQEQSIGGNAPLLARALASLGNPGTLFGCCGFPAINPIFRPLRTIGLAIHSIADPGCTDALEFFDGKILLGKMGELNGLSINDVLARLPHALLSSSIQKAEILVTVNWTMMPLVEEFWRYLLDHPHLLSGEVRKSLFVDLADPSKRPVKDLKMALSILSRLQKFCNVILGLNKSEALQVLDSLHTPPSDSAQHNAESILNRLQLKSVLVHTRSEAAVASFNNTVLTSYSHKIQLCRKPARTTGAGDTFNAGFLAGILRHQSDHHCLHMAVAASGFFVRTGVLPTEKEAAP